MSNAKQNTNGLLEFFNNLHKRLEHDVTNAKENGLDVDRLEGQGLLSIAMARWILFDIIERNLPTTENTMANRDNLLSGEAWAGSTDLLEEYNKKLEKLEIERLEAASFAHYAIKQVGDYQWEKMGAEGALDTLLKRPLRTGFETVNSVELKIMGDILQDSAEPQRILDELKHKTNLRTALAEHDAKMASGQQEHQTAINEVAQRLPQVLALADEAERKVGDAARAFRKAMNYLGLTERQKRLFALWYNGKKVKEAAKEVGIKVRQAHYELATVKKAFLDKYGEYPGRSGKKLSREEVGKSVGWAGGITHPNDPNDPDDMDVDREE